MSAISRIGLAVSAIATKARLDVTVRRLWHGPTSSPINMRRSRHLARRPLAHTDIDRVALLAKCRR